MHLVVLEFVALREAAGEVDHGLDRHAAFDGLVAAVQLGHRLLHERHPKLVGVGAPRVAVGTVALR